MKQEFLSPWLTHRSSGVLVHVTSLPGAYGIGNMGAHAFRFIDFLARSGFGCWQICPVGPTGYGDSPYQSFSTFAGNPYLIDLDALVRQGLVNDEHLRPLRELEQDTIDYGGLYEKFWPILELAVEHFQPGRSPDDEPIEWRTFLQENSAWLEPYALFMGLKKLHGGRAWTTWQPQFRDFKNLEIGALPEEVLLESQRQRVYQFWFFNQWRKLKQYANDRGIQVIGDVPIFVAHDSADVWQNPQVFRIHGDGTLKVAAGVPPDYFSEYGQFWGNPLYDWDYLRSTGYGWWIERLRGSLQLYDMIRLDHFRAFANFWEIPGDAADARSGRWVDGPDFDLLKTVHEKLPEVKIIAEDLGYIDYPVYDLRRRSGYPGMKVLQFGFGHDVNNVNLPHFFPVNSVAYTGTHDNDTTRGWLEKLHGEETERVRDYYRLGEDNSAAPLVHALMSCVSKLAIVPVQDLLDLGSQARMNTPGTSAGNWKWRMTPSQMDQLDHVELPRLKRLNEITGRVYSDRQHDYSAPPEEGQAHGAPAQAAISNN